MPLLRESHTELIDLLELTVPLSEIEISKRLRAAYQPGRIITTDGYAESTFLKDGSELKCAAVLIPLVRKDSGWHMIFTHRTDTVESHKGQVSFPGGGCNDNETQAEQTALREAQEEIGLDPHDVQILGRLNEVATITHYRVTPVVGVIPWPYKFHLSRNEVSRVFSIPLNWIAQSSNWDEFEFTPEGTERAFPVITYHAYDGEVLWGASARIAQNFLEVLGMVNRQVDATGK
ncbi:MAG: CoA pyrophosphatase [Chloroflexota bacterium]